MKLKLSENIKRLRKAKEMTQESLAELLNISSAAVSKWESNDTYPDITMIFPLAQIFGVSIDELMGYDTAKIEAEKKQVLEEYNGLYNIGRFEDAKDLIFKARKSHPNDYRIMNTYMWCKAEGCADNNPEILNKYHDEFIQICNCILENCLDEKIRLDALNMKAKLFHAAGDTPSAISILNDFPSWYLTSQQKTEQLFAKNTPEFRYYVRKNMYELLDFAVNKIEKTIWYTDDITIDEKINKIEKFGDSLMDYSENVGWEFFSSIAFQLYGCLIGTIKYLDNKEEDIIRITEKKLNAAKEATLVAKHDKVLKEYLLYTNNIDNLLEWTLNRLETTEYEWEVRFRNNPEYCKVLKKYRDILQKEINT